MCVGGSVCGCVYVCRVWWVCVGVCRCVLRVFSVSADGQINAVGEIDSQMCVEYSAQMFRSVHRCSSQFAWVCLCVRVWVCVVCVCGCVCVSMCVGVFVVYVFADVRMNATAQMHVQMSAQISAQILR